MAAKKALTTDDWRRVSENLVKCWEAWMKAEGMFPDPEFDNFMNACARLGKMCGTRSGKEWEDRTPDPGP